MPTTHHSGVSDYSVVGDGRTAALISSGGAVDWLCLPDLDATPTLARIVDAERGGHFTLAPSEPAASRRRYIAATNVLETTWSTAEGEVVVTDALVGGPGRSVEDPLLVRQAECRNGRVRMAWTVAPRFGDGVTLAEGAERVGSGLRITGAGPGVTISAEAVDWNGVEATGTRRLDPGERYTVSLGTAPEPTSADDAAGALRDSVSAWRTWSGQLEYDGPWTEIVLRSALAMRVLVRESTGALAAAATLGLPEQPGGPRNYDYRYSWLRDGSFVVNAFAAVGDHATARAYLRWMSGAIAQTLPTLQPFYRLDGGTHAAQRETTLTGFGGARPVRIGNRAFAQRQHGSAGDVLQSCALFLGRGGTLPDGLAVQLVQIADHVATIWSRDDAGIWETSPDRAHTWSKMACWVALTRAAELADAGHLEGDAAAWRSAASDVRDRVEAAHYCTERRTYLATPGGPGLDAAVLLGVFMGYTPADPDRWHSTLACIDDELGRGRLVYRTTALVEQEQTFLPCAFWRAHALVRLGRLDEAHERLDALMALANDVGLLTEEASEDGTAWGNLPQALTHAALVSAAVAYHEQRSSA